MTKSTLPSTRQTKADLIQSLEASRRINTHLASQNTDLAEENRLLTQHHQDPTPRTKLERERSEALDRLRFWCLMMLVSSLTVSICLISLDKAIDALKTPPIVGVKN